MRHIFDELSVFFFDNVQESSRGGGRNASPALRRWCFLIYFTVDYLIQLPPPQKKNRQIRC